MLCIWTNTFHKNENKINKSTKWKFIQRPFEAVQRMEVIVNFILHATHLQEKYWQKAHYWNNMNKNKQTKLKPTLSLVTGSDE